MNLIEKLLGSVFGSDDPARARKRQLKQIAKRLKRSKYKFYKPRGQEALPGLARFLFDLYGAVGPAQRLLQNAVNSTELRNIVVERYLSETQQETKEHFSEEYIRERAKNQSTKDVAGELKHEMSSFFGMFDSKLIKKINNTYNQLQAFLKIVNFDYYFTLRKFDSTLSEHAYNHRPKFEAINAEYITDDLKDFLEVLLGLEMDADWEAIFDVLQQYKGVEVISRSAWKKQLSNLEAVRRSEVLTLIVQHADGDPSFRPTMQAEKHRIVEPYLNAIKTTTEATLQKIANERRQHKVEQLVHQVFGRSVVTRTKYYTDKANLVFQKRMLAGFTHTEPLNYLKAFLLDYFKKDIREVVRDLLVVRGQWASAMDSKQLSEAFHKVMAVSEQVVEFDESLAEEGELGTKLKKASGRVVDKDKQTTKMLRDMLSEINGKAKSMIYEASSNLVTIGKQLKALIEDYDRKNPEMILNWKDLDSYIEDPIRDRMTEIYRQIYYFAQLMQMYVKK